MQWVKDLTLPQLWCRLQLQCRFSPWPGNFHMPQVWAKKKKKPIFNWNNHFSISVFFYFSTLQHGDQVTHTYIRTFNFCILSSNFLCSLRSVD